MPHQITSLPPQGRIARGIPFDRAILLLTVERTRGVKLRLQLRPGFVHACGDFMALLSQA